MIKIAKMNIHFLLFAVSTLHGFNVFAEININPYRFGQKADMKTSIQRLQHDPGNRTVTLIKGNLYTFPGTISTDRRNKDKRLYQQIAMDFVHHYRSLFRLKQPRKELVVARTQIDNLDYKHIRFQQVYKGIPVWDSEIIVHINTDEIVYLAGGHYIPSPNQISLKPSFNKQKAITFAIKQLPKLKRYCSHCTAKLVIYFDEITSPRLAYLIEAGSKFSGNSQLMLDAHSGDLLTKIPRIHTIRRPSD